MASESWQAEFGELLERVRRGEAIAIFEQTHRGEDQRVIDVGIG